MYEISLLAAGAVVFAFVAQCLSAAHVVAEREAKDTAALSLAAVNPTFAVALNTVWSMRALLVDGESERAGFTFLWR